MKQEQRDSYMASIKEELKALNNFQAILNKAE